MDSEITETVSYALYRTVRQEGESDEEVWLGEFAKDIYRFALHSLQTHRKSYQDAGYYLVKVTTHTEVKRERLNV